MPSYKYKVRDQYSHLVSGLTQANYKDEAVQQLHSAGYVVISLSEASKLKPARIFRYFHKVKLDQVYSFSRQLLSMQNAGIPTL